jgi:hypothetical protein
VRLQVVRPGPLALRLANGEALGAVAGGDVGVELSARREGALREERVAALRVGDVEVDVVGVGLPVEDEAQRGRVLGRAVGRDVLSVDDVVEAYRLRWYVELFFKQLKSGAGLDAIRATKPSAVAALVFAKVIVLCLARLSSNSPSRNASAATLPPSLRFS